MIERLQQIASYLQKFRPILMLLALGFLFLFVAALFELGDVPYDAYSVPAVVGFIWAVALLSIGGLFARVPPRPARHMPLLRRLKVRLLRAAVYCIAVVMLVLTGALFMLSSQLLRTWGGF